MDYNKYLNFNCAEFSYAEVPHYFAVTVGVTGTLKALTNQEKKIVIEQFLISNFTYLPSVYGSSKLKHEGINIFNTKNEFYAHIVNQIKEKIPDDKTLQRAVIVFFKSNKKLKDF